MRTYIFFLKNLCFISVISLLICFLLIGGSVRKAVADVPRNDSEDHSVEQVVQYHQRVEPFPSSIKYISWSDVTLLSDGLYKVTVTFSCQNRFHRKVIKKQIILLDQHGKIIKVMDCR